MAEYAGDVLSGKWSGGGGTLDTYTPGASIKVVVVTMQGYPLTTGDDPVATLGGNSADATLQVRDGDGDSAFLAVFANPSTGSPLTVAWSGLDASDDGTYSVFGVTNADADEIAATGLPDTGTDTVFNGAPSVSLTTSADDLCVDSAEAYETNSGASRAAPGAGQTEIHEEYQGAEQLRGAGSHETATGASVTMSYSFNFASDATYVAVVIPHLTAGGAAAHPAAILVSL